MKIEHELKDNVLTVRPVGELTYTTNPEFEEYLANCYEGVWSMVIDMKDLEYTASAGLRTILKAELTMKKKGGLKIINANETIRKAFEVSGFDSFLTLE